MLNTAQALACVFVITTAFAAGKDGLIKVADFGALGNGLHDDGPAISAAFEAAKVDGVPTKVLFEKKIYRIGDNPMAWHYFQMLDHENLVIDGGGATLLCADGNLAFYFEGGSDITVRGFTFEMETPGFSQGEVVAVNDEGSLDVKIMDGYPEPPDEAFLAANKNTASGGGGRHMIVFEQGGQVRNTRMADDHLYIENITRVSPGVFRFHITEEYVAAMKGAAVGDWVTYGFNRVNLSADVIAAKDKSASTYGQLAANRVGNIAFEEIDIFTSLNGGIRVSDMLGDVTVREVRIVRKPGTRNLLSIPSDALHLMSIRGKLVIENCEVEAPGDDCLNVGTLTERVVDFSKDDPKAMTLRTSDNRYYYYTIRKGDQLKFLNAETSREIGAATVAQVVEFELGPRTHRVVLDREIPGLDPAAVIVLNLNQMTSSTVIRNNVMRPYMRNAMLVRAHNMSIEGNTLEGTHGGVHGVNFSYSMGEMAQLRNVRVSGNAVSGFQGAGMHFYNAYRNREGALIAQDLAITGNTFQLSPAAPVSVHGVGQLSIRGNHFLKDGLEVKDSSSLILLRNCEEILLDSPISKDAGE